MGTQEAPIFVGETTNSSVPKHSFEILSRMAKGLSLSEIADELHLSPLTVKNCKSKMIAAFQTVVRVPSNQVLMTTIERLVTKGVIKVDGEIPSAVFDPIDEVIVAGIKSGKSNEEMAQDLNKSPLTVKNRRSKILAKLGARTRYEMVAKLAALERASTSVPFKG